MQPKTQSTQLPSEEDHNARVIALKAAVDAYGRFILKYFVSLTKDHHLAEDLSQDFWIFVFVNFPVDKFQHAGFLKRKAFHLFVDRMRHLASQKHSYVSRGIELDEIASPPISQAPANAEQEKDYRERFWANFPLIEATEKQKDCYWLKEHYGYTIVEISQHLKLPVSTVHRWIKDISAKMEEIWRKESE